MLPTLTDGDVVVVGYGLRPRPGRLVVVQLPPEHDGRPRPLAVKRVAGPDPGGGPGWWVERDNPAEGVDSWSIGPLPTEAIRAVVLVRLPRWALRRSGGVSR